VVSSPSGSKYRHGGDAFKHVGDWYMWFGVKMSSSKYPAALQSGLNHPRRVTFSVPQLGTGIANVKMIETTAITNAITHVAIYLIKIEKIPSCDMNNLHYVSMKQSTYFFTLYFVVASSGMANSSIR
jgi:hypothetical protein